MDSLHIERILDNTNGSFVSYSHVKRFLLFVDVLLICQEHRRWKYEQVSNRRLILVSFQCVQQHVNFLTDPSLLSVHHVYSFTAVFVLLHKSLIKSCVGRMTRWIRALGTVVTLWMYFCSSCVSICQSDPHHCYSCELSFCALNWR